MDRIAQNRIHFYFLLYRTRVNVIQETDIMNFTFISEPVGSECKQEQLPEWDVKQYPLFLS